MAAVSSSFSLIRTDVIQSRTLRVILATGTLTLFMVLGAMARFPLPFTPVPFTMQTFFLFYGAMALRRRSALSQGAYLGLGALGLPVFAGFAWGFSALAGPTGGYLFGFILSAFLVGSLISPQNAPSLKRDVPVLLLGMGAYFIPGVMWLKILTGLPIKTVLLAGFLPFVIGDAIKISLAYILYRAGRRRLHKLLG